MPRSARSASESRRLSTRRRQLLCQASSSCATLFHSVSALTRSRLASEALATKNVCPAGVEQEPPSQHITHKKRRVASKATRLFLCLHRGGGWPTGVPLVRSVRSADGSNRFAGRRRQLLQASPVAFYFFGFFLLLAKARAPAPTPNKVIEAGSGVTTGDNRKA